VSSTERNVPDHAGSTAVATRTPGWAAALEASTEQRVVDRLRTACEAGEHIVIAGHVAPDGDALGSVLALHLALRAAGARTVPTIGEEPLALPVPLDRLPGADDLVAVPALPPAEAVALLVTVDAASAGRLGAVTAYLDAGVETIVLDHHARNEPFGALRLVAPEAAATVQLVDRVLAALGLPLTRDLATCLYVGLVTDTGRFGFQATDQSAHELAGRLLAAGIDHPWWHQALYATRTAHELALLGHGLARLRLVPEVGLVHAHVTLEELTRCHDASLDGLVDLLRSADTAEVALALRPTREGPWKGSLRSRGTTDVGRVAAALGGGGHRLAAGFTLDGSPEDITARVVTLLQQEG